MDEEAQRAKQAEIERKRAEVRKRMEESAKTNQAKKKNATKGFMTPKRRKTLFLLVRKKSAEEWKMKEPERKLIKEKLQSKLRDLTSEDQATPMKYCKEYFDRMYFCEGQKSDQEHEVKRRGWEILQESEDQYILNVGTSTTFQVSKQESEVYKKSESDLISSFKHLEHYKRNHCTQVLQGTTFPNTTVLSYQGNGFVDTIISCYNGHHNLVMRPDDVWTAIITQFSFYVNKNAEKFRDKFVNFEGKQELEVSVGGTLTSMSYALLVKLMSEKIDENLVDPDVKSWVLPSFSTTTDNDIVTCGAVFMAAMKKYFNYKFSNLCGIPYVTLEGTVMDWENLCKKLEKLKEYELQEWFDMLKPILDEFVRAKKGNPDAKFWDLVCSHHRRGSGATYLSGWITAFCVFNKDGNWIGGQKMYDVISQWSVIDTNQIPPGIVEVDVKINDNGNEYYSCLFAGHLAVDVLDGGKTLQPMTGWVICLKPSPDVIKEIEEIEEMLGTRIW